MEDPFFPLQNLTSDLDVNMEEVSEIPSGSIPQHPLFIDSDSDDDCASDSTLLGDEIELETYSFNGLTLKPNKTVETRDGHFLRIERILEDLLTDQISLTGQVFKRTRLLNGLVEAKRNELVMIMKPGRSTAVVSLAEIVRIRELVITNQHFPAVSYREIEPRNSSMSESYINNHCRLVCRLKCAIVSKNKGYVRPLADHESDKGFSISDADLRQQFRGPTIKGGACSGWSDAEMAFEREERRRSQGIAIPGFQYAALDAAENRYHKRRYTFVDGFCGAGGASRGAQIAGFKILGAFDHNPHAVATYRQNFPHAKCEQLSAYDYAMSLPDDFKTDVLHLSPPCPTFSPMHVRPGRDDDMNEASFLATEVLIKKTKPRIVTLEETFGLVRTEANLLWFRSMIQIFTKLGFSVRWQVSNSLDFGLAQPRKRLIVFASCPGQKLPDFPEPTHCKPEDLHRFPPGSRLPYTTIHDAISRIPRNFPNHNITHFPPTQLLHNHRPYPSNRYLNNTILCAGNILHPSGSRYFTLREVACLQGFLLEHQFLVPRQGSGGGGVGAARRQIGNAWPPVVARVFFGKVREDLMLVDGVV